MIKDNDAISSHTELTLLLLSCQMGFSQIASRPMENPVHSTFLCMFSGGLGKWELCCKTKVAKYFHYPGIYKGAYCYILYAKSHLVGQAFG